MNKIPNLRAWYRHIYFMSIHQFSHAGLYLCIDMPSSATNSETTDETTDTCKTMLISLPEYDTLDKDATNKITSDIPSGIHESSNKADNTGTNMASSNTASGKATMYVYIYTCIHVYYYVFTHVCIYKDYKKVLTFNFLNSFYDWFKVVKHL